MKRCFFFTLLLFLLQAGNTLAQQNCATDFLWQSVPGYAASRSAFAGQINHYRATMPSSSTFFDGSTGGIIQANGFITAGCSTARYVVPVVIHIDESGGIVNISDAQVHQQLEILNAAFAPYSIRFVLAREKPDGTSFNGINRFNGSFDYRANRLMFDYAASSSYFDPANYFNIYVVPYVLNAGGMHAGINGFNSKLPNTSTQIPDLVVIRHTKFGNALTCSGCGTLDGNSRGYVLVHEAGHYLGLGELFEGGCTGGNDSLTCSIQGDLCCDTRPVNNNNACPVPPGNDCPAYHLPIGDNHENYMDYTQESCQDNFTPDQVSLMHGTLELYRSMLISPANINTLDITDCFATAWFDVEDNLVCDSGTFKLRAIEYLNMQHYRWIIQDATTSATVYDTTTTTPFCDWTSHTTGEYNVTLIITYTFGSYKQVSVTRKKYLNIENCGPLIPSTQGNWYFGESAGLKFTSGAGPVKDLGPFQNQPNIFTSEGTLSQSDTNGQLLFYGGGVNTAPEFEVYNRNYKQMPNSPLFGDPSSSQGGIVIPVPGQPGRYYLFAACGNEVEPFSGLHYSIVDMSLDNGLGDIDPQVKNVAVKPPAGSMANPSDSAIYSGEQITVIPGCGDTYWIIVVDNSLPGFSNRGKLLVYKLDRNGISFHQTSNITARSIPSYGQLKAAPNGNWLFLHGKLMHFDKNTGIISLYKEIQQSAAYAHASSFSADSRLLYATARNSSSATLTDIFQFDLESSNDSLSKVKVGIYPFELAFLSMQLGPDQKIYLSKFQEKNLGVINHPNVLASSNAPNACDLSLNGPLVASQGKGGTSAIGLPNMIDARDSVDLPLDFILVDTACGTVKFYPNIHCAHTYLWDFGDGHTSHAIYPVHSYVAQGSFTITLTVNGILQKTRTIETGVQVAIQGNALICDTVGISFYSIPNPVSHYIYEWEVINGILSPLSGSPFSMGVRWLGNGSLTLKATNPKNGCTADTTRHFSLVVVSNNTINGSQVICEGTTPALITGSMASAPGQAITYQWEKYTANSGWQMIPGATGQHYQPLALLTETVKYRRLAHINQCYHFSNEISLTPAITNMNIRLDQPADFKECFYRVHGDAPVVTPATGFSYQWYASVDGISFSLISGANHQHYWNDLLDDSLFLFRTITTSSCTVHSDTLLIRPRVTIRLQPSDYLTCNNHVFFEVEVNNPDNIPLSFTWSFRDDIHSTETFIPGYSLGKTLDYYINSWTPRYGNYYRVYISSASCGTVSATAAYIQNPPAPVFSLHPQSQTVKDLKGVLLTATATGVPDASYQWQKSIHHGPFLDIGPHNDTLIDKTLEACYDTYRYRVLAYNGYANCPPAISNTANITVTRSGDLWIKDHINDLGGEPNMISSWTDIWNSPDIWIRHHNDMGTTDEGFRYEEDGQGNVLPNYVYYRIRNNKNDSTKAANLHLYWSINAISYQTWDRRWTYNSSNVFQNLDGNNPYGYYTQSFPLGGEINTSPIIIPSLPPNGEITGYYEWDRMPNSARYYYAMELGNAQYFTDSMPVCMLARILTCDQDSFGLARKEGDTLRYNLLRNNNIAARNSKSVTVDGSQMRTAGWLMVGGSTLPITIRAFMNACLFSSYGYIDLRLDDAVMGAWVSGGSLGSGFSYLGGNLLRITNPGSFEIRNISLAEGELGFVQFEYTLHTLPTFPFNCIFTVAQYSPEIPAAEGAFIYSLDVKGTPPVIIGKQAMEPVTGTEMISGTQLSEDLLVFESQTGTATIHTVKAYPNPFNDQIYFSIDLAENATVGFEFYNSLGARIGSIPGTAYTKGIHQQHFDGTMLSAGVYLCRITINHQTKTMRLILDR